MHAAESVCRLSSPLSITTHLEETSAVVAVCDRATKVEAGQLARVTKL